VSWTPTDAGSAVSYQVTARVQHPFPQFPEPTVTTFAVDDFNTGSE
jgi:hypothetical protein